VTRVLVVDDEPQILRALVVNMRARGYCVDTAAGGASALRLAGLHPPDLVVLDLGLPDMEGLQVIAGLRGWTTAPIIVLTGRTEQVQKIAALDAGADDYVTKPLPMDELLARIRVALRRVRRPDQNAGPALCVGDLEIDVTRQRVTHAGRLVHLTRTEYTLLRLFTQHVDKLLTERMLLDHVWGPARRISKHLLHVYIGRLRKKLEVDPGAPSYVVTEPGGYRFATEGRRR
jgi:two-component system, OmpR family, KDP operon response regulator KdpE